MKSFSYILTTGAIILAAVPTFAGQQGAFTQFSADDFRKVEEGQFRCPETIPAVAEKAREMTRFLSWTKRRHPDWTLKQVMDFRVALLERNGCSKTLQNLQGHGG